MTEPSLADKAAMSSPEELLKIAAEAARKHQPDRMLEALGASGYLDGLIRRLEARWRKLDRMNIEECVAQAVDRAYEAITQGRRIDNLGAWLWKTSENELFDLWNKYYLRWVENDGDPRSLENDIDSSLTEEERARLDELAQARRDEAIRLARRLLPRIGQGQVVSVMELVIDAVEQGIPDLSASDIGNALGISSNAARTLLGRGFDRLRREARREGIELPEHLALDEQQDD